MKPKSTLRTLVIGSVILISVPLNAQSVYTWANSNVAGTPTPTLDWLSGGPNTQGTWTGGTPVGSNLNTIRFFQDTTTVLLNTATPSTQISNINNGGSAFELGTLTLAGRGSGTPNANLAMTISGDALNFSAATGTINLDALNNNRTITYNLDSAIQLGTAGSASALTITGNGSSAFNINGPISELQAGGGSLIKSGTSTVTLTNASNSYSGGTTVNAGLLSVSADGQLGASSSGITFNGGTLNLTSTFDSDRQINLNSGTGTIRVGAAVSPILSGKITGSGNLVFTQTGNGTRLITLSNIGNDFTGSIGVDMGGTGQAINLTIASLTDGVDYGNIRYGTGSPNSTFTYSGATDLKLDNRKIEFFNDGAATVTISSATNAINVNTDLLVSGTGAKALTLSAGGGVSSTWAGAIGNGSGAVALGKAGAGIWTLSGNNTYTGATAVNAGILTFANKAAKSSGSTVTALAAGTVGLGVGAGGVTDYSDSDVATLFNTGQLGGATGINLAAGSAVAIDTTAGNFTQSTALIAARALTKVGTNTLTITGTNTYTGGTNINSGTLNLGVAQGDSGGPLGGNGTVGTTIGIITFGGGTLQFSASNQTDYSSRFSTGASQAFSIDTNGQTVNWGIGNSSTGGTLTKLGLGTLNITTATNAWTGATTINGGILQVTTLANAGTNSGIGKGDATVATLVFGGGTLLHNAANVATTNRLFTIGNAYGLTATIDSSAVSATNSMSFTGTGSIATGGTGARTLTLTGSNSGANLFAPVIVDGPTSATSLVKSGAGNWQLGGANTYRGDTTITNGTLQAGVADAIPFGAGKGNMVLDAGAGAAGTFDINGFDVSINGLAGAGGTVAGKVVNNRTGTDKTLSLGNGDATASFAGVIANNTAGTGTVAVTKTGSGTQILSNTNTYTGATTIDGGTLSVTGSLAAGSAVTVNSGGTLGGGGTVAGAVAVKDGGILAPGAGVDVLTTGAATLESGSIFSWELNDNLATGREISYDGLTSSNLTIESGAIFRVVLTGAATLGDTFWNAQRSWTDIFSVSGTTDGASVASLFDSFQIFNGSTNITNTVTQGSFSFNGSTLDWSPVPEPTTALAGVLLVAGLLRRSRQRVIRC